MAPLIHVLFSSLLVFGTETTVADLFSPGEEVVWAIELGGARIGTHLFVYDGEAKIQERDAHRFLGWVAIDPVAGVPVPQKFYGELWTDSVGHLLRHVLEIQVGAQRSRIDVTVEDGKGTARITQGTVVRDVPIPLPGDVFLQTNNFIGWFDVLLRLHPPGEEPRSFPLLSSNSLQMLPYRVTKSEADDSGATFQDSLGEALSVDSNGRLREIRVASQKLLVRRVEEAFERFSLTVAEPADSQDAVSQDFDQEDVKVEAGDAVLAGTITRPKDAAGRLPAVFFISGSGLQDRHGRGGGVDVGTAEILDRLTQDGFLVLRIDDRGAGASTGSLTNLGFQDLVADARACVDYLLSRPDVDPERVALIGHSEGGITAPRLAVERDVAAVVLMAACGRPMLEIMLDQNRTALEKTGMTGEELHSTLEQIEGLLDRIAGDGEVSPDELPAGQRQLLINRKWMQDHAREDPVATIAKVKCPVLVLNGDKDFQISAEDDAKALYDALQKAGHPDCELHVFPDLDHLFKRVEGEESTLEEYFEDRPVDPEFLELLSQWLQDRLLSSR